jgi:hypothetical protein
MKTNAEEWFAWYNMMPGSPSTLHVTGEINSSETIGSARLVFDSYMKKLPPILVLRIQEHTVFVPRHDEGGKLRLHYSDLGSPGQIDGIIIVKDGETVAEIAGSDIQIVF